MSEDSKNDKFLHERKSPKSLSRQSSLRTISRDGEGSSSVPVLPEAKVNAGQAVEVASRPQGEARPAAEADGQEESLNVTKVLNVKELATVFSAGSKNPGKSSLPVADSVPVRHVAAEAESADATKLLEVQNPATVVSTRSESAGEKNTIFDQKPEHDQRSAEDREGAEERADDAASVNSRDELNTQSVTAATFRKIKLHDLKSSEESTAAPSGDENSRAEEPQVADESGATRFFQAPGASQKEHAAAKTLSADVESSDWPTLCGAGQGVVSKFDPLVPDRPVLESSAFGSSKDVEEAVGKIQPGPQTSGGKGRSRLLSASVESEDGKSTMLKLIPVLTILNLCFTALLLGAVFRLVHVLGGMSQLVSLLHR